MVWGRGGGLGGTGVIKSSMLTSRGKKGANREKQVQAVKLAKAMVTRVHFLSVDNDQKEKDGCWVSPGGSGVSGSCV